MSRRPPILPVGFAGCLLYLNQRHRAFGPLNGEGADLAPLTWGMPQGALLKAEPGRDAFGTYIGLTVRNRQLRDKRHEPHTEAKPRRLDPEFFLFLRLLLLPGGTVFLDTASNRDTPDPEKLFYLEVFAEGITALRLITDAQPGDQVDEAPDHHELRREFLRLGTVVVAEAEGKKTKDTYRGRTDAIHIALGNFDKAEQEGRLPVPLTRSRYHELLKAALRLLDERKLGANRPEAPRGPTERAA